MRLPQMAITTTTLHLKKWKKKGVVAEEKKEKIKHLAQQQHALVSSLTYPGRLCESLLLARWPTKDV